MIHLENYATEWRVTNEKIAHAFSLLKDFPWPDNTKTAIVFCLVKGIHEGLFRRLFYEVTEDLDPPTYVLHTSVIGPYLQWWMLHDHPIARKAQQTLQQLLFPPSSAADIPTEISFAHFVALHPEWNDSFIFFRDHPLVQHKPGVLIQRRQLAGNCYIHGPIVTHHYHLAKHVDVPVSIGIREFILRDLSTLLLAKLIVHFGGGSSEAF